MSLDGHQAGSVCVEQMSAIDCTVSSPAGIDEIANWNKGDKIHVEGIVKDVTFGSVYLDPCYLSK
jgi:hypothetical protein